MSFLQTFIRKPVFAWVINLVIMLLGLTAISKLELRQYPKIESPVITVRAQMGMAAPDVMATQVTSKIEEAVASISGLEYTKSDSDTGSTKVELHFDPKMSLNEAFQKANTAVGNISWSGTKLTVMPSLSMNQQDSQSVLVFFLSGTRMTLEEMEEYAKHTLKPQFEKAKGVAVVELNGGLTSRMMVYLDPEKMAIHGVTSRDIEYTLENSDMSAASGRVSDDFRDYKLAPAADSLSTAEAYEELVVKVEHKAHGTEYVRIKDVARVKFEGGEQEDVFKVNNKEGVGLYIKPASQANPVDIKKETLKIYEGLKARLPAGMSLEITQDNALYIEHSIHGVIQTLIEAFLIVLLVTLAFLGSFKVSIIPLVTIPISLLGVTFIIYAFGFSLNMLTLLALVLAVGLVVDDAIVVVENIHKIIEDNPGITPMQAAFKGVKEVGPAVIAMTLTLVAVYAPIALSSGSAIGRLFREFAVTLAGAVVISGITALTLSPMMSGYLLEAHHEEPIPQFIANDKNVIIDGDTLIVNKGHDHAERHNKSLLATLHSILNNLLILTFGFVNNALSIAELIYRRILVRFVFQYTKTMASSIFVVLLLAAYFLSGGLKKELMPRTDEGKIHLGFTTNYGAKPKDTVEKMKKVQAELLDANPDIQIIMNWAGRTHGIAFYLILRDWKKRTKSSEKIYQELYEKFENISSHDLSFQGGGSESANPLGGSASSDFSIILMRGFNAKKKINKETGHVMQLLRGSGLYEGSPEWTVRSSGVDYEITINTRAASLLNISPRTIATAINMFLQNRKMGTTIINGREREVFTVVETAHRDIKALMTLPLPGQTYGQNGNREESVVTLAQFIHVTPKTLPSNVQRRDGVESIAFNGKLAKGMDAAKALAYIQKHIAPQLSEGFSIKADYATEKVLQEGNEFLFLLLLALIFIFLILAAQFESFVDPLIILFSVPPAITGGLVGLFLIGESLSIYGNIGLITLIGLVTKHAILIVEFANQNQALGMDPMSAVVLSGVKRLRPIAMTTFAMVLGVVPLVIARGPGCEAKRHIGIVLFSGMTLGTLITLLVVPMMYILMTRHKKPEEFSEEFIRIEE